LFFKARVEAFTALLADFQSIAENVKSRDLIIEKMKTRISKMKLNDSSIRKFKFPYFKPCHRTDTNSILMLGSNHRNYIPMIQTIGDGNCLFRAVSNCLYGIEDFHVEIRARAMIELLFNVDSYADQASDRDDQIKYLIICSPTYLKHDSEKDIVWREGLRGLN
jgi:hypothetical protein